LISLKSFINSKNIFTYNHEKGSFSDFIKKYKSLLDEDENFLNDLIYIDEILKRKREVFDLDKNKVSEIFQISERIYNNIKEKME